MTRAVLHAVLRATPGQEPERPGAARVASQRAAARAACLASARANGLALDALPQDDEGVPQAADGWRWSISHARGFVAGVVHRGAVGIDVEGVKQRRSELVAAAVGRDELELLGGFRWRTFTRLWSAKEAVLKKTLVGLAGLSRCRLVAAPSERALVLGFQGRAHLVHQRYRLGHWASLCADPAPGAHEDAEVAWDWREVAPVEGPAEDRR